MNRKFYKNIKALFISVRFSYSRKLISKELQERYFYYKNAFVPYYTELRNNISDNYNYILIYCFDVLLDFMKKTDSEIVNQFANLIHNMPECCMDIRSIESFYGDIIDFNNKFCCKYFPFIIKTEG